MRADRAAASWPSRTKLEAVLATGPPTACSISPTRRAASRLPAAPPGPAAILIGPEGGFTEEERAAIRAVAQARPVSLGPRILRADTAALAALQLWMAAAGDW